MAPVVASALISAIPQAFKIGESFIQRRKGNDILDGLNRPEYKMPNEINQATDMAALMAAMNQLPGQSYMEGQMAGQLGNLTQDALTGSASSGDALAAIVAGYGAQTQGMQNMAVAGAQNKISMQQLLMEMLKLKATYKDQEFGDRRMRFNEDAAASRGFLEAAGLNLFSGLEGGARVASQAHLAQNMMKEGSTFADAATASMFSQPVAGNKDVDMSSIDPQLLQLLEQLLGNNQ